MSAKPRRTLRRSIADLAAILEQGVQSGSAVCEYAVCVAGPQYTSALAKRMHYVHYGLVDYEAHCVCHDLMTALCQLHVCDTTV